MKLHENFEICINLTAGDARITPVARRPCRATPACLPWPAWAGAAGGDGGGGEGRGEGKGGSAGGGGGEGEGEGEGGRDEARGRGRGRGLRDAYEHMRTHTQRRCEITISHRKAKNPREFH